MINSEMFAEFDVSCWTRDGMLAEVAKFGSKNAAHQNKRKISWKGFLLIPAATAAIGYSVAGIQAANEGAIIKARVPIKEYVAEELSAETIKQNAPALNFEDNSKHLLTALSSGKLPTFPAETLKAARLAANRIVSSVSSEKAPDWINELADKMARISD